MKNYVRLRTQVTVLVIFSLLIFSSVISSINLFSNFELLQLESQEKLLGLARLYSSELSADIEKRRTITESIGTFVYSTFNIDEALKNPAYLDDYLITIDPFLNLMADRYQFGYIYLNPFYDKIARDVWYLDLDKDGIAELMPKTDYEYYLDETGKEWFFVPMRSRKPYWTDPYHSTILDESIQWISYTLPIYIDDFFVGVVGSDFDYNAFESEFENIRVYNTGYAILLNGEGRFIVHPDFDSKSSYETISDGKYEWIYNEIRDNTEGIIEYTWISGEEKIMAYSKVKNDWTVIITSDKKEIYSKLIMQIRMLILITAISTVLAAVVMSRLIGGRMTMLEGVTTSITKIGQGGYDTTIPQAYLVDRSEVGKLGLAVEDMRIQLKKSFDEIQNYSENLERLVEERTDNLERVNVELEASISELKDTQNQLIETQKTEAISRLILEIAHRINTPLGNTTMTISMIDLTLRRKWSEMNPKELGELYQTVQDSTRIAITSTNELVEIIRSLKLINTQVEVHSNEHIVLEDIIRVSLADFNSKMEIGRKLEVVVPDTITDMFSSPIHLIEIFHYLFKYSVIYSIGEGDQRSAEISIRKMQSQVIVQYVDNTSLSFEEIGSKVFEPYALNSFKTGPAGVELLMVYNLVTIGLKGNIACLKDSDGHPYFEMILPLS